MGARTHEFPIRRFTHKFKVAPIFTGPIRSGDADAILQFFARTPEIYAPLHVKMESQSLGTLSSDQWASEMPDGKVRLGNVLTIAGWVDQLGYDSDTIKIVFVDKNYNDADDLNGDDDVTFAQTWYTKGRPDLIFVYLKYLQNDDATYFGHVPAHEIGHVLRGIGHTTVAGDYVDGTEAETGSPLQKYHVMTASGKMFGLEGEKSKHWMLTDLNYVRRRTPYAIPINQ